MKLRRFSSVFLLVLFSISTTPDQLIHLFTRHQDTVDALNTDVSVGQPHVHCPALQYDLGAFQYGDNVSDPGSYFAFVSLFRPEIQSCIPIAAVTCSSGRAPPAIA